MNLFKKLLTALLTLLGTALGYAEFGEIALSLPAIAGAVYFLTEVTKGLLNLKDDVIFILSWVFGGLLGLAFWYVDVGLMQGVAWYIAMVLGILSAGIANATYTSEWLEAILALFLPYFQNKQRIRDQKKARVEKY